MRVYFSPSRMGFFHDHIHGARSIEVTVGKARRGKVRTESRPNPHTQIPDDAVEITGADYERLLAELATGKVLALDGDRPIAVERVVPAEEILHFARRRRNRELAATDYTQLPDIAPEKRERFAKYRQALRDYPALLSAALGRGDPPDTVTFPSRPR